MSAFLCSDLHTAALAFELKRRGLVTDAATAAEQLRNANNKALAVRYGDKPAPFIKPIDLLTDAEFSTRQINTLARSFVYQCSEGDVMETHPIAPLLLKLIEATGGPNMPAAEGFWSI